MAIAITKLHPAHDFDSKPGTAKAAIVPGAVVLSPTGARADGTALVENAAGANNEGYLGISPVSVNINAGLGILRNTIIAGFTGVVPAKEVFLGQDGSITQNKFTATAPTAAPVPTEGAAGALAAGAYTVKVTAVDAAGGESLPSAAGTVTITASKKLHIAAYALPAGAASLNWYVSEAPGSAVLRFSVNTTDGLAFDINALPAGGAATPPTSAAATASRRVGLGFTATMIAFD